MAAAVRWQRASGRPSVGGGQGMGGGTRNATTADAPCTDVAENKGRCEWAPTGPKRNARARARTAQRASLVRPPPARRHRGTLTEGAAARRPPCAQSAAAAEWGWPRRPSLSRTRRGVAPRAARAPHPAGGVGAPARRQRAAGGCPDARQHRGWGAWGARRRCVANAPPRGPAQGPPPAPLGPAAGTGRALNRHGRPRAEERRGPRVQETTTSARRSAPSRTAGHERAAVRGGKGGGGAGHELVLATTGRAPLPSVAGGSEPHIS